MTRPSPAPADPAADGGAAASASDGPALRILHIVRQFHPNRGGLEDFVANLGREQLRAGHSVRVLTLDRLFVQPDTILPARGVFDGIEIERIPYRGSTRYPIAPGFLRHLGDADIVHVHAVDFFYDALAATRPLHRKPLVATTHGGFFHSGAYSSLKALWFNGPTRLSTLGYDAIVACSPQDAEMFQPIAGRRLTLIENGVDIGKFAGAASPVPVKGLVTIGRLASNKRLDRLLATLAELVREDPEWRLHIVGSPSDWTGERLAAEIAALNLGGQVDLHLGVETAAIPAILGQASIFVSASEYEGFGIALIEAASAGLMPIVHANRAYRDFAAQHSDIVITDYADPKTAAAAILAGWERLERMAPASVTSAPDWLQDYSWPHVAKRYFEVYSGGLKKG